MCVCLFSSLYFSQNTKLVLFALNLCQFLIIFANKDDRHTKLRSKLLPNVYNFSCNYSMKILLLYFCFWIFNYKNTLPALLWMLLSLWTCVIAKFHQLVHHFYYYGCLMQANLYKNIKLMGSATFLHRQIFCFFKLLLDPPLVMNSSRILVCREFLWNI